MLGARRYERIRCVDEHSAVPRRQALQRLLDIPPGNGKQDIVEACRLLADAPCPGAPTLLGRDSGPRRLLKTTSCPVARASRANASATVPAPIVPNFIIRPPAADGQPIVRTMRKRAFPAIIFA